VRSLVGFDARGLTRGAARRQLQRALESDDDFRARVAERFLARDDVAEFRDRWSAREALTLVDDAAREGKLATLASMLYAARPDGWTFGFGVAYAAAARDVEDAQLRAEARGRAAELAGAAEARRRADAARLRADELRERAEEELRAERQSRREGLAAAERARHEAVSAAEAATDAAARAARAEARVVELEAELAEARRRPQPAFDTNALRDVAHEMRGIADQLDVLASPLPTDVPPPAEPPVTRAPLASASSRPRPRPRRTRPTCPPGVVADSRAGLDGMLRTRGVLLVVDGYNVSKTAWGDAPLEEQRERLVAALAELHLRIRCEVIVVFDGADVRGVPLPRKPGVRVVFSDAGETADDVVVREAGAPPTTIPIIVASSDAEVRTRAEVVGAAVVQSSVLLSVLRR
jgi:predicted RNA-binding protein with PIN domain